MSKRVVAVYNDFDTARQVVEALVDAGFDRTAISIIGNDVSGEYRNRLTTDSYDDDDDVSSGEGAGFGAVVGALVGLGVALIPGIGPVLAAGPLAAALMAGIGAVAGAATGGIVAGLVDFGIPEEEANIYAENIRRGGTLVAIEVDDNRVSEAQSIMNRYNPIDVEQSEGMLRSSGWSRFDETSQPYTATTTSTTTSASPAMNAMSGNTTTSGASNRTSRSMGSSGNDEEHIDVVEEELEVGKREVEGGAVRVRSYVTETPVEEQVTLREETVNIERRPVDRPATDADLNAFQEKTIEMHERREVPVVNKVARVVEEVVISKDVEEHTETIRDTVRRTDVAVEGATGTTSGTTTFRPYTEYETGFRTHFNTNYGSSGYTYDQYSPAYRYGYTLATNERFSNYTNWNDLEMEARRHWEERNPDTWDRFKDSIRNAWMEVTGRR
jgi:uncharacterized protein (TIGR02271 family)